MEQAQFEQEVKNARMGNELARQNIIKNSRSYIINVVSHVCKRFVTWNDDEASIGLLAFNRAIDSYEEGKGRSLLSYAYCLIRRDLINHFRKNHRNELSLDYLYDHSNSFSSDEILITAEEIEISVRDYLEKVESSDLAAEISELETILEEYGIGFEELEASSPKHRDTRELTMRMIADFLTDEELRYDFIRKKRFPATAFAKKKDYPLKTVERHRKYLIAMLIIKLHPEWQHLSGYVRID
ncbi:MAG: sigma factor [Tissierellia bacterium]|nr:sigma factor [Tissierellia bacterium]